MFELIPSKYMRDLYKKIGFEFTDFQKATLIWNAPAKGREKKLEDLHLLVNETADEILKKQIRERIYAEKQKFDRFCDNSNREYVYIVHDEDDACCGCFYKYEAAKSYGTEYAKEYNVQCIVSKYLVAKSDEFSEREIFDYCGGMTAGVTLNPAGEELYFWCSEFDEEEKKIEYDLQRFENAYMNVPFDMKEGTLIKDLTRDEYAVLATGKKDWNDRQKKIEENNWCLDFGDVQVTVYKLTKSGIWIHEHIAPMYLEPVSIYEMPQDELGKALKKAMQALGAYLQTEGEDAQQIGTDVVKFAAEYSKKYFENCYINDNLKKAKLPEDIMW